MSPLIVIVVRVDLDPWERAEFLKFIREKANIETDVELGKLVGMSRQYTTHGSISG